MSPDHVVMVNANNQLRVIGNEKDVLTGAPAKGAVHEEHCKDGRQIRTLELDGSCQRSGMPAPR